MMSLQQLQADFQNYLLHSDPKAIQNSITEDARFSAAKRLDIYHTAYRLRLLEITRLDFTKTHTLLGDAEFDKAFYRYLDAHPSTHFSVRYFGQHFADFLHNTPPYKEIPVIAEMAYFEWLVNYTIDAPNSEILTVERLTSIPFEEWPELTFRFHPSVTSHYFHYDTPQLWQEIDEERNPRDPKRQSEALRWMFYRKGLRSYFLSCTPIEDIIFKAILEGLCFAEICEQLIDAVPEEQIAMVVAQTLHKWVCEEMIAL